MFRKVTEECKASIGKNLMRNIAQTVIKVPANTPQGQGVSGTQLITS